MKIIVILDNIRSAHNVGAILRTCDGAGVEELYLCGITPDINHKKIIKTALGAEKYVKTTYYKDVLEAINKAKNDGYQIISIEQTENSKNLDENRFNDKVCLIFGNEITGVSLKSLEYSDSVLEIPMRGSKNSLNVSTTVGIVLYYLILNKKQ